MRTWMKTSVGVAVAVAATTLITSRVVSHQYEEQMKERDAEMAAWMELAKPGKEHARLAEAVGEWKYETTHFGEDGQTLTSPGRAEIEPILDGRFIFEHVSGAPMVEGGPPFEGFGIYGFDNAKQKHVFAWVDNHGTMIMTGEGTADPAGKAITYYSEFPGPTGETIQTKMTTTSESPEKHVVGMYNLMPDNTWQQVMRIVSTRQR